MAVGLKSVGLPIDPPGAVGSSVKPQRLVPLQAKTGFQELLDTAFNPQELPKAIAGATRFDRFA